jgi:hypothetical protein
MPPKSKNIKNELEGSASESGDSDNSMLEGYSDKSHHPEEVAEELATIAGLGQLADIVAGEGEVQHYDEDDDAGSLAEPSVKSEPNSTAPTGSKAAILNLFSLFSVFPKPSL